MKFAVPVFALGSVLTAAFAADLPVAYSGPGTFYAETGSFPTPGYPNAGAISWEHAARAYSIGSDLILIFTNRSDTATFTIAEPYSARGDYLLVGGGGPGGNDTPDGLVGGGGGAGGFVTNAAPAFFYAGTYSVSVGAGGIPVGHNGSNGVNNNGGDSFIAKGEYDVVRAYGGGGGGIPNGSWNETIVKGRDGGSGGGGAIVCCEGRTGGTGVSGQGHDGGSSKGSSGHYYDGGGGGGAGAPGADAQADVSGAGGAGLSSRITGDLVWYAGGGAGGAFSYQSESSAWIDGGLGGGGSSYISGNTPVSRNGTDMLGGGGAGAAVIRDDKYYSAAGRGGSGIVVVRIHLAKDKEATCGDVSSDGAARIYNIGQGRLVQTVLVFTNTESTATFTLPRRADVRVLLVGGGGPGGVADGDGMVGGGGGAGGVVTNSTEGTTLISGTYTVIVGKGGHPSDNRLTPGENGGDSVISLLERDVFRAKGGGAGGNPNGDNLGSGYNNPAFGRNGGSGGGGAVYYHWWNLGGLGGTNEVGQGHGGGQAKGADEGNNTYYRDAGGGGGAGAPGGGISEPNSSKSGAGGDGIPCDITGETVWYAGGGAGGAFGFWGKQEVPGGLGGGGQSIADSWMTPNSVLAENGVDGTGGGGAGATASFGSSDHLRAPAGRGGDGIVIVRVVSSPLVGTAILFR